jgi:uncharacterized protein (TIGR02145 family)
MMGLPPSLQNKFLFLWTGQYDGDNLKSDINTPRSGNGLFYNWYATSDVRGLVPDGWHIPSKTECDTLIAFLGGEELAAKAVKEVGTNHWLWNLDANNSSGFTFLGSSWRPGYTEDIGSSFELYGTSGQFWTTTVYALNRYWMIYSPAYGGPDSEYNTSVLEVYPGARPYFGLSVRLVRDSAVGWTSGEQMVDYDGNLYDTVQIGTQIWTVQNLAVTHYKNGDPIPEITDDTEWEDATSGALCAYENDWSYVFEDHYDIISVIDKDWVSKAIPPTTGATFAVLNNATYLAADGTDDWWFNGAGVLQQKTHADLIISETMRTFIKYADFEPYDVSAIGILKDGEVITEAEKVILNRFFKLWAEYWGLFMDSGYMKDNRIGSEIYIENFVGSWTVYEEGDGLYTGTFIKDESYGGAILWDNYWDWPGATPPNVVQFIISDDGSNVVTVPLQNYRFGDNIIGSVEGTGFFDPITLIINVALETSYDGDTYNTVQTYTKTNVIVEGTPSVGDFSLVSGDIEVGSNLLNFSFSTNMIGIVDLNILIRSVVLGSPLEILGTVYSGVIENFNLASPNNIQVAINENATANSIYLVTLSAN